MSAISLRAPVAPAAGLRGPIRVLLHQHRRSLWAAGALLVLGIAIVVGLRIWVAVASSDELCADGDITRCGDDTYQPTYARAAAEAYLSGGGTVVLLLAALIGVFVAGPLIARELESGTFRLAWAQSVSPAQWLAARLALPAALVTAGTTVLVLVYRWGWSGLQSNPHASGLGWYENGIHPALGPTAVGYALLALAVGALCAVAVRRTVLSMGLTALVLGTVMLGFGKRRYELWPTARFLGDDGPSGNAWHIKWGMLTASGKEIYWKDCFRAGTTHSEDPASCLRNQGGITYFADYHPTSHFWPLQLVETGILLALAALAVALAFRVLRRRHG
ncbi:ABC transporter permease [Streptomyces sp. NBC_01224]|uniref:ABC transporter permease n=1 Tax=Streptomyces sp. NBC_01224 TaxID=2903783 RepID=UPI002E1357AF|nr:ABC transporter permease [Streptomyces sp. NBC_01224]